MIGIQTFRKAARLIGPTIIRTPLVYSPTLSDTFGGEIYLKLENLQTTGSFKIRGAAHKLLKIRDRIGSKGVVAVSAGNHAQGVALAAKQSGIPATIIMPEWASISKQEATRSYGGKVIIFGKSIEEGLKFAQKLVREGKTFIHPFDDPDIIAGQGTIALEIFEDLADAETIIVPVGGGGIISGIAACAKALNPLVKVVGVQTAACPSAIQSIRAGKVVQVQSQPSIADGISVKQVGRKTFEMIRRYVDDIVLVDEMQISAAVLMLLERKKVLAEGAGAVPVAALLGETVHIAPGTKAVLVISGGNVDSPLLDRIILQGLLKKGRIMRIRVRLQDIPGALAKLLDLVARYKANVLHIYHDRYVRENPINITHVELEMETRGPEHVDAIARAISEAGYEMTLR